MHTSFVFTLILFLANFFMLKGAAVLTEIIHKNRLKFCIFSSKLEIQNVDHILLF